jgi:membrane-associated phospholipid phosphatase
MNHLIWSKLRLHEWAFGLFLLVTSARLLIAGCRATGLMFCAMAAAVPIMVAVAARWPGPATARLRLVLFPVWINLAYSLLGSVVAQLKLGLCDATLLKCDIFVLGETPARWLGGWNHPAATDFLSACYLLFFPAVLAAFIVALTRPESSAVKLFNGLITIYAIGFFGYTLVPAAGPHLAMAGLLPTARAGGVVTRLNADLVAAGSNRVDVFPSLHVAIVVFLMGVLWSRQRGLFSILLIPAAGLCAATLYLGYHYAVDLAAGLLLAACGLLSASIPIPSHESHNSFR